MSKDDLFVLWDVKVIMLSSMFKCRPLNVHEKKRREEARKEKEWCNVQENMKTKEKEKE